MGMGLGLSTNHLADLVVHDAEGAGWFCGQLEIVNQLLEQNGLPRHVEPETFGPVRPRRHVGSFPYSFLHYLRRAFARLRKYPDQPLEPVGKGEDPADDPAVEDAGSLFDSHLLCHSDAEGFYVPIAFDEVIFDLEKRGLAGAMLGSSVKLMHELSEVAPALGITLVGGTLPDAEAARLAAEDSDVVPFGIERLVWLALHETARVSIAGKTLLVFC
jgi:hypothetical protein